MKSLHCLLFLTILCVAGCNKPAEPKAKPEPAAQEQMAEAAQKDVAESAADQKNAANAAPDADDKLANAADVAQAKPQNAAVFKADFKSSAVPELHTHETVVSEEAWGKIKRTTVEWADDIEVYHEIPVFDGDDAAIAAVNAEMQNIQTRFLSAENLKSAWEYEYARHQAGGGGDADDKYTYTYSATVKEVSEKYVSVTSELEWYMGGVLDYGTSAYVYDRVTGKRLGLADVYGKDAEAVHKLVTRAVRAYADANVDPGLMEWGSLEKMTDFSFYMEGGVPHVVFKKYEIAAGAAGAFDIELPKP